MTKTEFLSKIQEIDIGLDSRAIFDKVLEMAQTISVPMWHKFPRERPIRDEEYLCVVSYPRYGELTKKRLEPLEYKNGGWKWADAQVVLYWTEIPTMADFEI